MQKKERFQEEKLFHFQIMLLICLVMDKENFRRMS